MIGRREREEDVLVGAVYDIGGGEWKWGRGHVAQMCFFF